MIADDTPVPGFTQCMLITWSLVRSQPGQPFFLTKESQPQLIINHHAQRVSELSGEAQGNVSTRGLGDA